MGVETNLNYASPLLFPAPIKCRDALLSAGSLAVAPGTAQTDLAVTEAPSDQSQACQRPEAEFEASELCFGKSGLSTIPDLLQDLKSRFQARFKELAVQKPEKLEAIFRQAFGPKLDQKKLTELMNQARAGSMPLPANIRILGPESLNEAGAAYSRTDGGTIFIGQFLLDDPDRLFEVFAEETGHHLDQVLGGNDSPGDEGEILACGLLKGEPLTDGELREARAENDQRVIKVDGVDTNVECFVLPALPVVAAYLGKTALASTVDFAFEYAIAALTGVPPTALDLATDVALNLVPGIDGLSKSKKMAKLLKAIENVKSAMTKIKGFPGGHKVFERFDAAQKALVKCLNNLDAKGAEASIKTMLKAMHDAHKLQEPAKILAPVVKYLPTSKGKFLGEGGNKDVFDYGHGMVVAILKQGKPQQVLDVEMKALAELKRLGFPTVEIKGVTHVGGQSAVFYKKYAQGSKDVVRLVAGKPTVVGKSPFLNQQSIRDLRQIRQRLLDEGVQVDDIQFLIGKDGHVVIGDPRGVKSLPRNAQPKTNLQIIDLLIKSAEANLKK